MFQGNWKFAQEENLDRYKYFYCIEPPTQMIRKKKQTSPAVDV